MNSELEIPRRAHGDSGASLVEYALLLTLIALACFGALFVVGGETSDSYDRGTESMFGTP